jgi:hypothetical protein
MKPNQTILLAVLLAGTTTLAAEYYRHEPVKYGRTIAGAVGMGFFLSLLATGSPEVAQGLAYVIMISATLVNGEPILNALSKGVNKK